MKALPVLSLLLLAGWLSLDPVTAQSASYQPLGEGMNHTYQGIPFQVWGTWLDAKHAEGEMVPLATLDLTAYGRAKTLHLLEYCSWADNVPDGVPAGHAIVFYADGSASWLDLVVGVNTAEWSYDCPCLSSCLQHSKVSPAFSSPVEGQSWEGHQFYAAVPLQDKPLNRLELLLDPGSFNGQQSYGCSPPDWFGVTIDAVTVEFPPAKRVFVSDFNSGPPPDAVLFGSASVAPTGGVDNSGVLKLTVTESAQMGSLIINDLNPGIPMTGFTAQFKLYIGGGSGADGFSFNFANDLPDGPIWEEGAGSGLRIVFDTFDNGGGEAPSLDVVSGGIVLGTLKGVGPFIRPERLVDVLITLDPEGNLSVLLDDKPFYQDYRIFYTPTPGRFGLGARTGGANDNHWVDDLRITTQTERPARPVIRWALPSWEGIPGPLAEVKVQIQDGTAKLQRDSIVLTFDGLPIRPVISEQGDITTLTHLPPFYLPPQSVHFVSVQFADETGVQTQYDYKFFAGRNMGDNGNYYEFVSSPFDMTWESAGDQAAQRSLRAARGYLATLTNPKEDALVDQLRQDFVRHVSFSGPGFWVGGYQLPGSAEPGQGWMWINGDGPIAAVNGLFPYANWQPGQPGEECGPGSASYLAIGDGGWPGWNDHGCNWPIAGYVVEYTNPFGLSIDWTTLNSTYVYQGSESREQLASMVAAGPVVCRQTLDSAALLSGASPECGLNGSDHAYYLSVKFPVNPCQAGPWSFRLGTDFGRGGVLFLDGIKIASAVGDLWWASDWDSGGVLATAGVELSAGWHWLEGFGFEDCCGGDMSLQYQVGDGLWQDLSIVNLTKADRDEDGLPDCDDTCPASDLGATVIVDGCDTGVANRLMPSGCTISDLIANCASSAANHGHFVAGVEKQLAQLQAQRAITPQQKARIVACAARSRVGSPAPSPR